MFRSFIRIAFRNLIKHRTNTLINIFGLAVGFSSSILIMNYVYHEMHFDDFHENKGRIYRLWGNASMTDGKVISTATTSGRIPERVIGTVPGAEAMTRVYGPNTEVIRFAGKRFTTETVTWVDSSFFKIFSFNLISGNPENALKEPFTAVLSQTTAKKFFGDTAMNQVIQINRYKYRITGVYEDFPNNSHFRTDVLAAFMTLDRPEYSVVEQNGLSFPQYYMLGKDADPEKTLNSITEIADKVIEERLGPYGIRMEHQSQPLERIHLYSNLNFDIGESGDIRNIYIFAILALFIMLIAVMNFINLVTAQSDSRSKEIGIRKVSGAGRSGIVKQFLGESVLMSAFAVIIALLLNEGLAGYLSGLLDQPLPLIYWNKPGYFAAIILFGILIGVLAGLYPAFYLSSFQPVKVLKGDHHGSRKPHFLRKIMTTLQIAITVFLIICLLLLQIQVNYMKNTDLGFKKENIVVYQNLTDNIKNSIESLKAEMLANPNVVNVATSQSVPGKSRSVQNLYRYGDDPKSAILTHENRIQDDFVETMGMEIIMGRDFDKELKTDTASFILNEMAVKKLGLENPIGEKVVVWSETGTVIGVVRDFNYLPLNNTIDPLVLTRYASWFSLISVRIRPENIRETITYLDEILKKADPSYTPEMFFIDQTFKEFYEQEEQISRLITVATILAAILSVLGLYGLTTLTIRKKVKEIGIRKALGGSITSILFLLFKDLSRWVIVGNIIAWPIAFWTISRWLQNFAFRIEILEYWWVFIAAAIISLLIGILTMSAQTIKAARANPVDALRYE